MFIWVEGLGGEHALVANQGVDVRLVVVVPVHGRRRGALFEAEDVEPLIALQLAGGALTTLETPPGMVTRAPAACGSTAHAKTAAVEVRRV